MLVQVLMLVLTLCFLYLSAGGQQRPIDIYPGGQGYGWGLAQPYPKCPPSPCNPPPPIETRDVPVLVLGGGGGGCQLSPFGAGYSQASQARGSSNPPPPK